MAGEGYSTGAGSELCPSLAVPRGNRVHGKLLILFSRVTVVEYCKSCILVLINSPWKLVIFEVTQDCKLCAAFVCMLHITRLTLRVYRCCE